MEPTRLFDIKGKVAIVTGAGGGIGGAIARAFLALGAEVVGADVKDPAQLPEGAVAQRTDLADRASVLALAAFVARRFGRADILINNAGITEHALAEEMPLEEWERTLRVNLTGTFQLSQAIGRLMIRERRGKIVNVASRCGYVGIPFNAAYNASKAGVTALTQTLAVEWAVHNIQVNAIVPGFVRTGMTEKDIADAGEREIFARKIPLGRISEPDDLVGAAVFLSSPASDYVTGASLFVDGGNYASGGIGAEARDNELARRAAQRS
jgi:NAD(P)-dependent dehydrogenase (short-subunit alcohol dehydrogenase family)